MDFSSLKNIFSKKNVNLIIGLISLLLVLWIVMFVVPGIFVNLFDTLLGNLILIVFIILAGVYNITWGFWFAVVFIILFRFSHMSHSIFSFHI